MKTKLALALTVCGIALGLASTGMAANSDDGDVTVNVSEKVKIDVAPDSLAYGSGGNTAIEPGTFEATSDNGYDGIEIENSGSVNLSTVWVETSYPSTRPYGTGTAGAYDAGNMIQLRGTGEISGAQTLNDNYRYAGRKEFNESSDLSYVTEQSGASGFRYGRFRVAGDQYFWAVNDTQGSATGGNTCAGDGNEALMIGKDSHTKDSLGSVDFSNPSDYHSFAIGNGGTPSGDLGRASVNVSGINYAAYTWCGDGTVDNQDNDTYVAFHGWDRKAPQDATNDLDTVANHLLNLYDNNGGLKPGSHFTVETRVSVPFGTAEGTVGQGNMTIFAAQ